MQDPQEVQQDLQKQFRNQQQKYIYYIIALSVACIGFAVDKSMDQPLRLVQIPLGVSVLSWGLCIYFGFSHIQKTLAVMTHNSDCLELEMSARLSKDQQKIEQAEKCWDDITRKSEEGIDLARFQYWCFFFGIVAFVTWHVLEMYYRTIG